MSAAPRSYGSHSGSYSHTNVKSRLGLKKGAPSADLCLAAAAFQDHMAKIPPKNSPDAEDDVPRRKSMAQQLGLLPLPPTPLKKEEWKQVEKLARKRHVSDASELCPICREPFGTEGQVLLSCSHVFHKACMHSYETHCKVRICPLCRQEYRKKTINDSVVQRDFIRIQAAWRGYQVRKWYKQYRSSKTTEQIHEENRRECQATRLAQAADKLLAGYEHERDIIDREIEDIERSIARSKAFYKTMFSQSSDQNSDPLLNNNSWELCTKAAVERQVTDCMICLMPLAGKEQSLLSCSHVFHTQCILSFEEYTTGPLDTCPAVYNRRPFAGVKVTQVATKQTKALKQPQNKIVKFPEVPKGGHGRVTTKSRRPSDVVVCRKIV